MDTLRDNPSIRATVRTLITLDIALIMGVVFASGLFAYLKQKNAVQSALVPQTPVLTYLGAGMGGMMIVIAWAIPGVLDAAMRRRLSSQNLNTGIDEWLAKAFVTRNILIMALLEGGALLNAVFYFLDARPVSLVVVGVMAVGMSLQIPSLDRLVRWIEAQKRQMETSPSSASGN